MCQSYSNKTKRMTVTKTSCRLIMPLLLILWLPLQAMGTVRNMEGEQIDPFDDNSPALVFYFAAVECPIANRYLPRIKEIYGSHVNSGFKFYAAYTDASASIDKIEQHRMDYSIELPLLLDFEHELVNRTGVTTTPEVAVYFRGENGYLQVYRGRVDDRYIDFGKFRKKPTQEDLKDVLLSLANGKHVQPYTTKSIGCYITR